MRRNQRFTGFILWFIIVGLISNMGILSRMFDSNSASNTPVTQDMYMTTDTYRTEIEVNEDNSYSVQEQIDVVFDSPRHGIYRYIPYKGVISEVQEDGDLNNVPYYGKFSGFHSSETLQVGTENGNKVLRFGDEDEMVSDSKHYTFSYKMTPVTSKGYEAAYYNVFPVGWRNVIPAGSSFTIKFPKDFDHGILKFYWGSYGEQKDASEIVDLTWTDNTVVGVLKEELPMGSGMTFYAPMKSGYFTDVNTAFGMSLPFIVISAIVLAVLLVLFFFFGRDIPILPSIQYQPPSGLDSAAVGYIIDGSVSDEDVTSLFVFWADRGFIKIRETKNKSLAFTKLRDLPPDAPAYARKLFDGVFTPGPDGIGKEILVSSLKYKLADTFGNTKVLLRKNFKSLYTTSSRVARAVAMILSIIPMVWFTVMLYRTTSANALVIVFAVCYLIGLVLFNRTVDFWYSKARSGRVLLGSAAAALCVVPLLVLFVVYGIGMIRGTMLNLLPAMGILTVVSLTGMVLTGFMKKRTPQCVEWMGYLVGLRDFIETAELERMKVIAQDDPHLFYHILPFAYVFGLTDILLDRMKELSLPAPDWYETANQGRFFDFYLMHYMLHTNMRQVTSTISTPRPPEPSSNGSSGGSFGGGGFSGGGFSGGGFGGGGGGSW